MHVDFTIRYDTEPDYDIVRLEYQGASGVWTTVASFSGLGTTGYSALISDAEVGATVMESAIKNGVPGIEAIGRLARPSA